MDTFDKIIEFQKVGQFGMCPTWGDDLLFDAFNF